MPSSNPTTSLAVTPTASPQEAGRLNFIAALTYAFRERGWPGKLGIAVLAAAIPVLGYFIIKGWEFEISVRVRHGSDQRLPGWGNAPSKLGRGLLLRLAGILYNLPTYLLVVATVIVWGGLFVRFFGQDPATRLPFDELFYRGLWLRIAIPLLALVYALAANFLYWSGYLRYIETRRFVTFFEVVPNMRLAFANMTDDFVVAVFETVAGLIATLISSLLTALLGATGVGAVILPIAIPALTFTFLSAVSGYLFGQLAIRTLDA